MTPRDEHSVRSATPADAAACRAIYAPYVEGSVISFEEHPPDVEEMRARIESSLRTHAWVVLEDTAGTVVGYAYGTVHKPREAYRWACEVSVYVAPGRRRTGAGRALYEALFERLVQRGYLIALAGMTLPNPASAGLHRALGFEDVGTYRRIGFKHGAWHDTQWLQRPLGAAHEDDGGPPPDPS